MVKKRMEDELRIHQQNYRLHDGTWLKCIPDNSIKDAILDIYNYTQTPAFSNVIGSWVSVLERLPNDNRDVVVYLEDDTSQIAHYDKYSGWCDEKDICELDITVLYWIEKPIDA